MINFVICDDEGAEREYLTALVRKWAGDKDIKIREFDSGEAFLFQYEDDKPADILLLDIQMKKIDGVTLAKKIRAKDKEVQIIFVTGYMDYISDGYDVEALHYLLKPVTEEKFFAILNRASEKLVRNQFALYVSHMGMAVRIPFYQIRYLEVRHNHVTIFADEEYVAKTTLNELEKELVKDDVFFRVGRSYIVNLRSVKKCTKTEIYLAGGEVIPMPRGVYTAINKAMIERL